ncbi:MAG: MopE-related protein [archaeon]
MRGVVFFSICILVLPLAFAAYPACNQPNDCQDARCCTNTFCTDHSSCRIVFVSHTINQPSPTTVDVLDAGCQQEAEMAGLTGRKFVAWWSSSTVNASDRLADGRFVLVDGTIVANDKADLLDGSIDATISRTAADQEYCSALVRTGTNASGALVKGTVIIGELADGTTFYDNISFNCNDLVGCSTPPYPYTCYYYPTQQVTGYCDTSSIWTYVTRQSCFSADLYCFQTTCDVDLDGHTATGWCGGDDCNDYNPAVYQNAVENCHDGIDNDCNGLLDCWDPACSNIVDCNVTACCKHPSCASNESCRLLFVTASTTQGAISAPGFQNGIFSADAICQQEAETAGLSNRRFVAWLSTTSTNAKDRIIDGRFVSTNSNIIAFNKSDLTDSSLSQPLYWDASGNAVGTPLWVWTGTYNTGTKYSGRTCGDWLSTSASGMRGHQFYPIYFWTEDWRPGGTYGKLGIGSCTTDAHLYCFQTTCDLDNDGHNATIGCGGPDCNDYVASIHPGAIEICGNGIDEDCDGSDAICSCTDVDMDEYGSAHLEQCLHPELDCNDNNNGIYPGAPEICGNGIDEDCDGSDTACPCPDADGDTYQAAYCGGLDCDDNYAFIHPGAFDICDNGIDEDCSGSDASCTAATGNLTGFVRDNYGEVVGRDAHVIIYPEGVQLETTVDFDTGAYVLSDAPVGSYYASADKQGYSTDTARINITEDNTTEQNFTLYRYGCRGDCTDYQGRCNALCEGISRGNDTCTFFSEQTRTACSGRRGGTLLILNATENTYTFVQCCESSPYELPRPLASLGGIMENIVTYIETVTFEGFPARLVIVTWS